MKSFFLTAAILSTNIAHASTLEKEDNAQSEEAKQSSGVTFIDVRSSDEVLRQYLLPLPAEFKDSQRDETLHEFINQKIRWEDND